MICQSVSQSVSQKSVALNFYYSKTKRFAFYNFFVFLFFGFLCLSTTAFAKRGDELLTKVANGKTLPVIVRLDLTSELNQTPAAKLTPNLNLGTLTAGSTIQDTLFSREAKQNALSNRINQILGTLPDARSLSAGARAGSGQQDVRSTVNVPTMILTVNEAQLKALLARQDVMYIQENRELVAGLTRSIPFIGGTSTGFSNATGRNQIVVIGDEGLDRNHPAFAGRVLEEACFRGDYTCANGSNEQKGVGASNPRNNAFQHGAHVTGIAAGNGGGIKGVASGANIISALILDSNERTSEGHMLRVMDWVDQLNTDASYKNRIAAVNFSIWNSFGSISTSCQPGLLNESALTLRNNGIATIIITGNGRRSTGVSPLACGPNLIRVSSVDRQADTIPSYADTAPGMVDLLAPGGGNECITSAAYPTGTLCDQGTSMAAPHVAGAFAVMREANPSLSVAQILSILQNTGVAVRDARNGQTYRRIALAAAVNQARATPTNPPVASSGPSASTLTGGKVGVAYNLHINHHNTNSAREYSATGGVKSVANVTGIPPGLAIQWWNSEAYSLNGTPTQAGTFTVKSTVTSNGGAILNDAYTITISSAQVTTPTASAGPQVANLSNLKVGQSVNYLININHQNSNSARDYQPDSQITGISNVTGIPPGLSITWYNAKAYSFIGTPTQAGTFSIKSQVKHNSGGILNDSYNLVVKSVTQTLPTASAGPNAGALSTLKKGRWNGIYINHHNSGSVREYSHSSGIASVVFASSTLPPGMRARTWNSTAIGFDGTPHLPQARIPLKSR